MDRKLVHTARPRQLPSWVQFKYLPRFLGTKEKKVLWGGIIALWAGLSLSGAVFIGRHLLATPGEGGEYSEALVGQPKYINPLFSVANDIDADLAALIYSGLFRYDNSRRLVPHLAEEYTLSDDKKTYTIKLRQGVRWSDGEPMGVGDVLLTFELIQNPEVGSPLLPAFHGVTVEKTGERTVRFTLKEPFAPFIHSLTIGIIPEHIWGSVSPANIRLAKTNLQPVGTGAWQLNKLVKDDTGQIKSYALSRNEHYFEKKPYLKTLQFQFFPETIPAIEALRSQEIDAVSFLPRESRGRLPGKKIVLHRLQLPQYTALFFNQTNEAALKDKDVRLALAQAIDKKTLIDEALSGWGSVIDGPILEGSIGYYPNIKKVPFDSDAGNSLLDKKWPREEPEKYFKQRSAELLKSYQEELEALAQVSSSTAPQTGAEREKIAEEIGQSVRKEMSADQAFYRRSKDGRLLRIVVSTVNTPEYVRAAEFIASAWRKLGVQTTVRTIETRHIVRELLKNRNYQVLLYGEIIGFEPDPFPFWHSSQSDYPGLNLAQFSSHSTDRLLEEARTIFDNEKRAGLYRTFQATLADELPAIFLYSPVHTWAVHDTIKGLTATTVNTPADRFGGSTEWYTNTNWRWK